MRIGFPTTQIDTVPGNGVIVQVGPGTQVSGNPTLLNALQLCDMGLHRFHLDVMLSACGIRKVRETGTTRYVPAS